jgi:Uma2 family endonuclease
MTDPARRLLTYDDLLALEGEEGPEPELIDGMIAYKASPRAAHARGMQRVSRALGEADDDESDAGWWILVDPDVRLALRTVVRPDVAGWRKSTLPELPEGVVDVVPDWICEILSPGHEAHDTRTKRAIYFEHGVGHYGLLNPEARTLEAFAHRPDGWLLLGTWTDGDVARVAPFEAIELAVGRLFVPKKKPPTP